MLGFAPSLNPAIGSCKARRSAPFLAIMLARSTVEPCREAEGYKATSHLISPARVITSRLASIVFMSHSWFVIDAHGRRAISRSPMDFWSQFDYSTDGDEWPEFTQLIVNGRLEDVVRAFSTVAATLGLECADVTTDPERWGPGAIHFATADDRVLVTEPGVDRDERFLHDASADAIIGLLARDGVFFGHDPSTGLIHITTFELGAPSLAWYDSIEPGPSFARTFLDDGRCTDEDPRTFALERLDMPPTSPLLDRYRFVESVLSDFGVGAVTPDLDDLPVDCVLRMVDA
jgi:hypothetical protein